MSVVINETIPLVKPVKNLGWLLRHWKEVQSFTLMPFDTGRVCDGLLVANTQSGTYLTSFASFEVARQWLHRPVFRGLPLNDCGSQTTC